MGTKAGFNRGRGYSAKSNGLEDQARALESANSAQYLAILQQAINESSERRFRNYRVRAEVIKEVTSEIEKQKERISEIADRIGRFSNCCGKYCKFCKR